MARLLSAKMLRAKHCGCLNALENLKAKAQPNQWANYLEKAQQGGPPRAAATHVLRTAGLQHVRPPREWADCSLRCRLETSTPSAAQTARLRDCPKLP